MSFLKVETNIPLSEINDSFFIESTDILAKTLNKSPSEISVFVNADQPMIFGGSQEPAAIVVLQSVGGISPNNNKNHSAALFPLISKHLKVQENRISIAFNAVEPHDAGVNGKTFIQ
ncbi:macrophage migration inhibitory factor homolog [Daktulosphaira vitifoliae]|uniref:macrophage migration inhibitory factor homolog n=1 Tax=Daktulosphaira vitifoliae TaxID=58002 RepID=UPI0021AAB99D|nr:macrophage migration inhibitory factor homolog [Daktulosphaira vitifoliae]